MCHVDSARCRSSGRRTWHATAPPTIAPVADIGADVSTRDVHGPTPLHNAARSGVGGGREDTRL